MALRQAGDGAARLLRSNLQLVRELTDGFATRVCPPSLRHGDKPEQAPRSSQDLPPSTWSIAICLGRSQGHAGRNGFWRSQRDQHDAYDEQGRNIAKQVPLLADALQSF